MAKRQKYNNYYCECLLNILRKIEGTEAHEAEKRPTMINKLNLSLEIMTHGDIKYYLRVIRKGYKKYLRLMD